MDLRSELLKSIWYGFTALDLEKSGKVSKSQLKVSEETSPSRKENKWSFVSDAKIVWLTDVASFPTRIHLQQIKVFMYRTKSNK